MNDPLYDQDEAVTPLAEEDISIDMYRAVWCLP